MGPLLVASIASSLPSIVSAGEKLLEKTTPKAASTLNAAKQAMNAAKYTSFERQLNTPEQITPKPISLSKYLRAEGLHNQAMLKEHTFHLEHQFRSHPDLAHWIHSLPESSTLELGYNEKDQLTIQTESGFYQTIDPKTPLGALASRIFELRTLENLASSTAGIPLTNLAQSTSQLRHHGFFKLV
ncbi:MAG: hypothetical protein Tsb0018_01020 [Opitutales bacterium]|tara:strand:+ start:4703 stop:5257 length:555 start_codon:yes stop_codon:yes gene_type:complete